MILYVPFKRDNAGDLVDRVEQWKKNPAVSSQEPIHLIYYDDDFDAELILSAIRLDVYICAHGLADDSPLVVTNNADLSIADRIDVEEVSRRFLHDFLFVSHQFAAIHLYCCGSETKNSTMASLFHQSLLRPDLSVHSYNGTVTIPDNNGVLWSFGNNGVVPVKNTAKVHYKPVDLPEESEQRMNIKQLSKIQASQRSLMKLRHSFFEINKQSRDNMISHYRNEALSAPLRPFVIG